MEMLKKIKTRIKRSRRDVILTLVWTAVITLMIIETHQTFYREHPYFLEERRAYSSYEGPAFSQFDLLLVAVISGLISMFLTDAKSVILGYFASILLSSVAAVVYLFLYIWFVLDLGPAFSTIPYGWEWVIAVAIQNLFRYMVPMGITFCLIGAVTGSFIRVMVKP